MQPGAVRRAPPKEDIAVEVIDLAEDGRGVARQADGKVVFVTGALPGERVRLRLRRRGRAADEGVVTAVERAAAERVVPRCPHFGVCGGCALQHLAPSAQLAFKHRRLLEVLARVGGVRPEEIAPPLSGPVWHYRRRARLGVKRLAGEAKVRVGFREREAPRIAAIESCAVLDARIGENLSALAETIAGLSIAGRIPQVEIACADHVALVLRALSSPNDADLARLARFAAAHDYDLYLQTGGPQTLTPLGAARPLEYAPDGGACKLRFGPLDFVQINAAIGRDLVRQALQWLEPQAGDEVLELFAGLGHFTLPLARSGARVTAVEGDAELVARGRENLARNGCAVRYVQADLAAPDHDAPWLRARYDLALLDPPRSGAREMLPYLARSGARRIVYVSCHPGTLARDAGILVQEHGYALRRAGVLDMFPHTAHVESMALFERP
ncbi:MAG: 23S rRNA (uracil(1939)-C(5))-methyltransferase RlmD [Sinobacteraceae bacterium]|nr:23S rRNA (uracil(1939)-C(5))-methyltransferase RlmD [Nevskiaceae bacterium]